MIGPIARSSERFATLGCVVERSAGCSATSAATATSDVATAKVIPGGWIVRALVMTCHNETDGHGRAGSRDDIDASHGAATMRADGDLTFGEGIVAGFLISRSVADGKELTAEDNFIIAPAIGEEAIVADAVEAVR